MVPLSVGRSLAHEPCAACLSDKQQPVPERLHASDDARVDPGGPSHIWWVNFSMSVIGLSLADPGGRTRRAPP